MGKTDAYLDVKSSVKDATIDFSTKAYVNDTDNDYRIMQNVADAVSTSANHIAIGHGRIYGDRIRVR